MDYIAQQDGYGCGIASIANATGLTYDEAKTHVDVAYAVSREHYSQDIAKAMGEITGNTYAYRKAADDEDPESFPDGAIVFIENSDRYAAGHWLTKVHGGWADPWINLAEQNNLQVKAGLQEKLPGKARWIVYQV